MATESVWDSEPFDSAIERQLHAHLLCGQDFQATLVHLTP